MSVTIRGATFVRADRTTVWAALYDVDLIASCLPGCRSLTRTSDRDYALALRLRLGLIAFSLTGVVRVTDRDPPHRYCLTGHAGSPVGAAMGAATINLVEQTGGCRLHYAIEVETDGLLSKAGPVVLLGIGTSLTGIFARRFGELVDERRVKTHAAA